MAGLGNLSVVQDSPIVISPIDMRKELEKTAQNVKKATSLSKRQVKEDVFLVAQTTLIVIGLHGKTPGRRKILVDDRGIFCL